MDNTTPTVQPTLSQLLPMAASDQFKSFIGGFNHLLKCGVMLHLAEKSSAEEIRIMTLILDAEIQQIDQRCLEILCNGTLYDTSSTIQAAEHPQPSIETHHKKPNHRIESSRGHVINESLSRDSMRHHLDQSQHFVGQQRGMAAVKSIIVPICYDATL
ncbi:hypothetical protein PROFUN_12024 [Planoprotostelium fungivorum]|uniref:Uncharacterized protein n=1 Tax=Planoprotostelium fungivorum TaxID=1890364 RepID=A0A2P6MRE7_9EUKA|nr:hypothetical protein PROFUN_12024 [Planoprotostelium fungivorum]